MTLRQPSRVSLALPTNPRVIWTIWHPRGCALLPCATCCSARTVLRASAQDAQNLSRVGGARPARAPRSARSASQLRSRVHLRSARSASSSPRAPRPSWPPPPVASPLRSARRRRVSEGLPRLPARRSRQRPADWRADRQLGWQLDWPAGSWGPRLPQTWPRRADSSSAAPPSCRSASS